MCKYLVSKHKTYKNLFEEMARVSWTEYTLYWLYLRYVDNKGIKFYYKSSNLSANSLTVFEENYKQILTEALQKKTAYFVIIQSNVYEYNVKALQSALQSYLS